MQCFAGGLTLGAVQAGFELVGKREHKGAFGAPAMEKNRHLLGDDWDTQEGTGDSWEPKHVSAVFANPPCSAFSTYSSKAFRGMESKVSHCMYDVMAFSARCDADIVVMESVQQAFTQGLPMMRKLREQLEDQSGQKYTLTHLLHNTAAFRGPAERRRYFLVAHRVPFGIERPAFIPEEERTRVADVWGDLVHQPLSWTSVNYIDPPTPWSSPLRTTSWQVDGHDNPSTSPDRRRINDLLASVEWNVKEGQGDVLRRHYELHGTLPDSWLPQLQKHLDRDFRSGITTPGRWRWDGPGRVIMGSALDLVIHPLLPRLITHREALRMMAFPDDWRVADLEPRRVKNYWGKGVTVTAGHWIGGWAKKAVEGTPGSYTGVEIGERERVIDVTHDHRRSEAERARLEKQLAKKFGVDLVSA